MPTDARGSDRRRSTTALPPMIRLAAAAAAASACVAATAAAFAPPFRRPTATSTSSAPPTAAAGTFAACATTSLSLSRRTPPTTNFDLDAILALEEEMDAAKAAEEEKAKKANAKTEEEDSSAVGVEGEGKDEEAEDAALRSYVVPPELDGSRIDAALGALDPDLSRSLCGTLVSDGLVSVAGVSGGDGTPEVVTRKSHKVSGGDVLAVRRIPDETPEEIVPQDIPLDVLFEDEHMIVLNKAAGMVVHPAAGNWDGTVVNALAHYLAKVSSHGAGDFVLPEGGTTAEEEDGALGAVLVEGTDGEAQKFRPGVVHRLDKGTTGVLVVAKTREALAALSESFAQRRAKKAYVTVTVGNPGKRVTIDRPIGRHPTHRQRMRVVPEPSRKDLIGRRPAPGAPPRTPSQAGRRALSFVDTLAFDGRLSVAEVRIETGRTHQIRVHLQDRRTPVYGDDVYGLPDWNKRLAKTHSVERPLLHAAKLEIDHPVTGERLTFRAPLAQDMAKIVDGIWPQGREERPDLFGG
uniref:Pseudouridine synthase RsuA/RluA-like domain-containing protein n=1 Tax=Odontella aurita TaxID=265563 RepID=A0A7S4JE35_9STRA